MPRISVVLLFAAGLFCTTPIALRAAAESADTAKHRLIGAVKDAAGNPLRNAIVAIGGVPTLFARERGSYTQTTATGAFELEVAFPGTAMISVWHPDYISKTLSASTEAETEVRLSTGEVLEGTIPAEAVTGARAVVSVWFPGSDYQEYTRVDAEGRFRFANLPAGKCTVEYRADAIQGARHIRGSASAIVIPRSSRRVLLPGAVTDKSLRGSVRDTGGTPAIAQVTLRVDAGDVTYLAFARSDSDGNYHFENVPEGDGQLWVTSAALASEQLAVPITGDEVLAPIALGAGQSLRCTFLNTPDGTRAIHVRVLFGKVAAPSGGLAEVRALFDAPAAWSGVVRERNIKVDHLAPGSYTVLAYPMTTADSDLSVFEIAELLRLAPVYLDTVTIREAGLGATVAASFPSDVRAAHAAAQQPMHPIIGRWAYEYRGSVWTRTFTPDGRRILMEGPVTGWVHPYAILGDTRVCVFIDGTKRIHTIRADGKLDVEGQFIATKVQ